jgi:inorganic triphosphatase YgiF
MGREFELKFRADNAAHAALCRDYGEFHTITMETTYYDTPHRDLADRLITLRRRLENGVSVCTVKTPAKDGARGEWELPWENIETAVPKLCKLGCPEELLQLTTGGLVAICGARFIRKARTIILDSCTVELALDSGVLLGGNREEALNEVEVEVKSGSEAAGAAFARDLADRYGLVAEPKSKFRRALDLATGG